MFPDRHKPLHKSESTLSYSLSQDCLSSPTPVSGVSPNSSPYQTPHASPYASPTAPLGGFFRRFTSDLVAQVIPEVDLLKVTQEREYELRLMLEHEYQKELCAQLCSYLDVRDLSHLDESVRSCAADSRDALLRKNYYMEHFISFAFLLEKGPVAQACERRLGVCPGPKETLSCFSRSVLARGDGVRVLFRGDHRPPTQILNSGFAPLIPYFSEKGVVPVYRSFAPAADILPDTAVCFTPSFDVACLFPLPTPSEDERIEQDCTYVYVVQVPNHKVWLTHVLQQKIFETLSMCIHGLKQEPFTVIYERCVAHWGQHFYYNPMSIRDIDIAIGRSSRYFSYKKLGEFLRKIEFIQYVKKTQKLLFAQEVCITENVNSNEILGFFKVERKFNSRRYRNGINIISVSDFFKNQDHVHPSVFSEQHVAECVGGVKLKKVPYEYVP